jgi:deoxyribonuclease-1
LAAGINSFSQAKAAGVKVNADVPGDFTAAVKLTGREKRRYRSGILRL